MRPIRTTDFWRNYRHNTKTFYRILVNWDSWKVLWEQFVGLIVCCAKDAAYLAGNILFLVFLPLIIVAYPILAIASNAKWTYQARRREESLKGD